MIRGLFINKWRSVRFYSSLISKFLLICKPTDSKGQWYVLPFKYYFMNFFFIRRRRSSYFHKVPHCHCFRQEDANRNGVSTSRESCVNFDLLHNLTVPTFTLCSERWGHECTIKYHNWFSCKFGSFKNLQVQKKHCFPSRKSESVNVTRTYTSDLFVELSGYLIAHLQYMKQFWR